MRGTSLRVPGQEEAAQGNPGVFERKEGTRWFYRMAERSLWASSGASAWTLGRKSETNGQVQAPLTGVRNVAGVLASFFPALYSTPLLSLASQSLAVSQGTKPR